jgi:drug/metabolite transporter (DMT)-like permease
VGWAGTRWQGILCAVVAGSSWAVAEALDGRDYDTAWVFLWNSLTRLVVFLTIAVLLHRARSGPGSKVAGDGGLTCPHCASTDTVVMRMGLVCRSCKRLS